MTQGLDDSGRVRREFGKPVIGLAGGIGAGKTAVARVFESLGAAVIDSDRLAHEVLQDPDAVTTLREWWGDSILSSGGAIDRAAVGELVFRQPAELKRLEGLLYPLIERRRSELMAAYAKEEGVKGIVVDAPKLYEAGVDKICDVVVFVEADRSVRVSRVADSRGWTEEELDRRESLQNPLDAKKASADYVVTNNSGIEGLRIQVERVFSSVLASFT
ncbi:MAG: dephospho-CoA kinase [Phycisphaerae bacterium]